MLPSIQPKLKQVVKVTVVTTKRIYIATRTTLANAWKNHKKAVLWGLGLLALAVIGVAVFVYLWRKSPTFRAMVLAAVAAAALNANNLLAWLKGRAAKEETLAGQTAPSELYPDGLLPDRNPAQATLEGLNILTAEDPALVKSAGVEDGHMIH